MSLDDFKSSDNNNQNSGSSYHVDDDARYKDKEWLKSELEDNSIQGISDKCGVAYNSVYYQIDKHGLNDADSEQDKSGNDVVEQYISQFIETDGSVQVNVSDRENTPNITPNVSCTNNFEIKIASLMDAEGHIDVRAQKQRKSSFGYKVLPNAEASQSFHEQQVNALRRFHSMIETFCEHIGISHNFDLNESDDSLQYKWRVNKWEDVKKVLETIRPHSVIKTEQMAVFLDHVYPMYKNEKHKNKDGFLEMMDHIDTMADLRDNNGTRKYDKQYFVNNKEW